MNLILFYKEWICFVVLYMSMLVGLLGKCFLVNVCFLNRMEIKNDCVFDYNCVIVYVIRYYVILMIYI